jgi:tetratricopeptide (TPR) repeat protein
VAVSLGTVGNVYHHQKKYSQADTAFAKPCVLIQDMYLPERFGWLRFQLKDYREARVIDRRVIALPLDKRKKAIATRNLLRLARQKRRPEAVAALKRAFDLEYQARCGA